ncbi:hypothetical protein [Nostoc sp. C110]|uniref:hypothetical protein n=1 Tax=Nostoc sp. C110 TaxID=3349876 RepID=UPI00370D24EA
MYSLEPLLNFLEHQSIKKSLELAKNYLEKAEYETAIAYATIALEIALALSKITNVGHRDIFVTSHQPRDENKLDVDTEVLQCLVLGIDYIEYRRYRRMAGYYHSNLDKIHQKSRALEPCNNLKAANYAIEYCIKTIETIQNTVIKINTIPDFE